MRTGFLQQRRHVFAFPRDAVMIAVRPAQTPSAPIRDVNRERVGQKLAQLHEVLRGLHGAVQQDDSGTVAEPAITDHGSISGDYGVSDYEKNAFLVNPKLRVASRPSRENPMAREGSEKFPETMPLKMR